MRKIALFLLFYVFVFGFDFSKELADFDKNYKNVSYEEKLKLHHSLKNIYIKTIINNNDKVKIKALERLVLSADSLGLESSLYKNELDSLYKKYPKEKKSQPKPTQTKKNTNSDKKNVQNVTPAKKVETPKQVTLQPKQVDFKTYILGASSKNNTISLKFNSKNIKSPSYHTFKNNDVTHHIFTFENIVLEKPEQFDFDDVNASLVQYNPNDARLVIRSKNEINVKTNIKDENLEFVIDGIKTQNKDNAQKQEKISKIENPTQNKEDTNKSKTSNAQQNTNNVESSVKAKDSVKNENNKESDVVKKNIYILQSAKFGNEIKLHFNTTNIQDPKISNFKSGKTIYNIYTFNDVIVDKPMQFEVDEVKVSVIQYTKKDARVVFSSFKEAYVSTSLKDDLFVFKINGKSASKQTPSKQPIKQNNTLKNIDNQKQILSNPYKQKKLITIDAGHGGKDGGANFDGRLEKNITLQISLKLKKELEKRGYKVYLTRSGDKFISLRNRTKMANDKMSDLFISIHANSVPASKKDSAYGIETYFLSPARSERSKNAAAMENQSDLSEMDYFSKQTFLNFLNREKIISSNKLAIDIQSGMLVNLKKHYKKDIKDGGVREAPFWVLVGALMPAVLIEVGYITHPIEGKNIATSKYQDNIAIGIADGIEAYFSKNH